MDTENDEQPQNLETQTYQQLLVFHQAVLAEANQKLSTFIRENTRPNPSDADATKKFKEKLAPFATAQVTARHTVIEHQKTNPNAPNKRHQPSTARRAKIPSDMPHFQPSATTTDLECEEYLSAFESKLRANNVATTWLDANNTLHHDWSNALPLAFGKTPDAQHLQFVNEQLIKLPWEQARIEFKNHFAVHVELFGLQRRVLECTQGESTSVATHIDNFRRVLLNAITQKDATPESIFASVPLVGYILFQSLLPKIKARVLQQDKLANISTDYKQCCREYIAAERSLLSEQALTGDEPNKKTSKDKKPVNGKRKQSADNEIVCNRCLRPGHKKNICFATHYQGPGPGQPGKLIESKAPAEPPNRGNKRKNNSNGNSGKHVNDDRCTICKSPSHHASSCPTKLQLNNIRIQNMQMPSDMEDNSSHDQPNVGPAKKKKRLKLTLKKNKIASFCSSCGQRGHAANTCLNDYGNNASDSDSE